MPQSGDGRLTGRPEFSSSHVPESLETRASNNREGEHSGCTCWRLRRPFGFFWLGVMQISSTRKQLSSRVSSLCFLQECVYSQEP